MGGVILTPTSRRALEHVAQRGRAHTYRLARTLNLKWSTSQDVVRRLKKGNLIRFIGEEPGEKRRRLVYGPTIWGLEFALQQVINRNDWEAVDEIAKSNVELWPLVLGRWEYFKSKGLEEQVRFRLASTIARFVGPPQAWDELSTQMKDEQKRVQELTAHFYERLTYWVGNRREMRRWYRALAEDAELLKFVMDHRRAILRQHRLVIRKTEEELRLLLRYSARKGPPSRGRR
jgi:DNA-binding MarR family transcriptional regulator